MSPLAVSNALHAPRRRRRRGLFKRLFNRLLNGGLK